MSYIINSYRFAGEFEILDLNPLVWLKHDDVTISSGVDISSINDKSGNGYNYTQGTTSLQPDDNSTDNSIDYDGTDDTTGLATSSVPDLVTGITNAEVCATFYVDSGNVILYSFNNSADLSERLFLGSNSNKIRILHQDGGGSADIIDTTNTFTTGFHKVSFYADGTAYKIYVNDSSTAESLTVTQGSNVGNWLGDMTSGSNINRNTLSNQLTVTYTDLRFKELIYFDKNLTDTERGNVFSKLENT